MERRISPDEALGLVFDKAVSVPSACILIVVPGFPSASLVSSHIRDKAFGRLDLAIDRLRRRITFTGYRSTIDIITADRDTIDRIRGPQYHLSWAFDLERAARVSEQLLAEVMHHMMASTRLGDDPMVMITDDRFV